ncbi:MAG: histidine kinase dimerization/phospho-acceptor domain-containing protein [Candidatus Polarisedimenticolia bacterium]
MADVHRRVVSGLDAALLLIDPEGGVVFCNAPAIRLLGRDLAGSSLQRDEFDDDLPVVGSLAARFKAASARQGASRELMAVSEGDESRYYWMVLTDAGPDGAGGPGERILMMVDVGEVLSSSAAIRKVFSQVNHDLRSPLTSISGAAELLQSGRAGDLPGMQKRLVTIVEESARKMTDILSRTKARLAEKRAAAAVGEKKR